MTRSHDETAEGDDVETVLTKTERSNGDSVGDTTFDDPEEAAAFWRTRFERERKRLAKLLVAYKDLEAELELREEEAQRTVQRKAVVRGLESLQEHRSEPSEETVAASEPRTALEDGPEGTEAPSASPEPAVEEEAQASGAEAARASQDDPFGHVHPVVDVEGIGEVYTDALEEAGIADSRRLWLADADEVAEALDVSPKVVRRWQAQAELMALDEVGPQYAELLARSGVTSIEELRDEEPADLLEKIESKQDALDVRIQGNVQSERRTKRWIEAARNHDT